MARRDKNDIKVSDTKPHAEAVQDLKEQAATLVKLGRADTHGVYVDKDGRGYAVFLHKRDPFDMSGD